MKRNFLLLFAIMILNSSLAQFTVLGSGDIYYNSGNVGIGTTSPAHPLEVKHTFSNSSGFNVAVIGNPEQTVATSGNVTGTSGTSRISHSTGTVSLGIGVAGACEGTGNGNISSIKAFSAAGYYSGTGTVTNWSCYSGTFSNTGGGTITNGYGLYINAFPSGVTNKWGVYIDDANAKNYLGGSLGIGTNNLGSFKLAVEGNIGAREIMVTATTPFPDYVFESKYDLMSLDELRKFLETNKHLPNIPTASEIKAQGGIELGMLTTKLVEKIEELTLYILQLKKENDAIKEQLMHKN